LLHSRTADPEIDSGPKKLFDMLILRWNRKAWEFFNAQPPWYRRVCIYWVTSGKKEETRARRLATLIEDSASGRRIGLVTLKPKNG
jgi:uncharacterized protein YdeI (YjbR/CyaY-like superfamily)